MTEFIFGWTFPFSIQMYQLNDNMLSLFKYFSDTTSLLCWSAFEYFFRKEKSICFLKPHITMQASYEGPKTFAWIIPWFAYYLNQVNDTSDNTPSIAKGQPAIHNSTHTPVQLFATWWKWWEKVTHVNLMKANICHVNANLQLPHFTQHSIERLLAGTANVFKPW